MRVVRRIKLRRRRVWIAWSLWVGGSPVALGRRRGLVVETVVKFFLRPVEEVKISNSAPVLGVPPALPPSTGPDVLPRRGVGIPGAALGGGPAAIVYGCLGAVVRRPVSLKTDCLLFVTVIALSNFPSHCYTPPIPTPTTTTTSTKPSCFSAWLL